MLDRRIGGSRRSSIACKPFDGRFDVVNSCSGLLCLSHPRNKNPLAVCNPVAREFIRLPDPLVKQRITIHCEFGFDPQTNEYKVVRAYKKYTKISYWGVIATVAEMHTLGTKVWKTVGQPSNFLFQLLLV